MITPASLYSTLDPRSATRLALATLHDRAHGVLLGSALGDAIGLYTEFLSADRTAAEYPSGTWTLHPAATPFARDFHRLKHRPGEWTDDTDHALLILLSFLHSNGHVLDDPKAGARDLAERLHVWVDQGLRALDTPPLGLGATVGAIVRHPAYLADPVAAAHDRWENGGYDVAPNGSVMRTHPLGVMTVGRTLEETWEIAARYSCVTHVDPRCVVGCMIEVALIRGILRGEVQVESDVDATIDAAVAAYNNTILPMFRREGPFKNSEPGLDTDELRRHTHAPSLAALELDKPGIGYVLKTLGSGILLLRQAMRAVAGSPGDALAVKRGLFDRLVTELVRCGGDADTNAACAGALLGAYVGFTALPAHWTLGLRHGTWLRGKVEAMCVVLGVREGTYDGKQDRATAMDGGRGMMSERDIERRWMLLQARMAEENREVIERTEAEAAAQKKSGRRLFGL